MRGRLRYVLAPASVVAVVLITVLATSGSAAVTRRLRVVDHAKTDTVVDIGSAGDSTGDVLTFHNKLYRRGDVVGRDQGTCIRIKVPKSWECTWTNFLSNGHISVEGPFFDTHDSNLAVIGGTGAYRNASGQMHLHALNGGKRYVFSFELTLG